MRTIVLSVIISLVMHVIFFAGAAAVGYFKSKQYEPDIASRWENIEPLQQEAAFGFSVNPLLLLVTFIGVAILSGAIIAISGRMKR
jgi:menaquinol-cytochrome c reductase cytochrome b subunit